jgi:uncharacterized phage protein (TIGR02218 family)
MTSIADGPLTSVAFCWRLDRFDGAGLALTSNDRAISHEGVEYRPAPGITPAAITRSIGLEPDSGEIAGALSADALTDTDLSQGRWNGAAVSLLAIDWMDPGADAIPLLAGELGEAGVTGDGFAAELKGAASRLLKAPCPSTSPECRAVFGDKQCRVDLAGRSLRVTVISADGNILQLDQVIEQRFLFGRLRYLSGENCGLGSVVLAVTETEIALRDRPRSGVEAGTVVELREGCDKRFETCVSRFQNGANFRGEPHLPGTDLLTRYPGA